MIERLVAALNSITTQAWAFLMLVVGVLAVLLFHRFGIAVDSAAAVMGAAVNMFTGLVNKGQPGPSPTTPVIAPEAPKEH